MAKKVKTKTTTKKATTRAFSSDQVGGRKTSKPTRKKTNG